ncbi:zinc finger BED domain-containing protein DAYSLEEPER-like [Chenopodium quinoa]|nr:zinc finger BED domain-containing protein DAYSLEEPER-like [Chenopodium quinoa]
MNGMIENGSLNVNGNGIMNGDGLAAANDNDVVTPEVQPNKRRRKKSMVWEYFTTENVSPGCTRACCKQCNKSFAYITGKKQAGTSHLKRHISLGICPANRSKLEKNQLITYTPRSQNSTITAPPRKRCRASPGSVTIALDQERCINEIARMIILHDYPTNMVELPGFVDFAKILQPNFSMVSFDSVHSEIVAIYTREKKSLADTLAEIPGRVSLTVDLWTSDQTLGYAILTGHFIDADWRLNSRVLRFVRVPFPDSQVAFNHAVVSCLSEWGLGSKLFALAVDQSFANEAVVGNLRGLLSIKNSHMLNGQYLLANCYARVMSRMALAAIGATREAVAKVRDSVRYVKVSESREDMFNKLRQQLQIPYTESLVIDDQRMWNSTYHMLSIACELKEVFSCLDASDPNYELAPSMDDWKCIEVLCVYLKLFFDAADILTTKSYPTASAFFHEVCKIQMELAHGALSEDNYVSSFVRPLYEKFDRYWRDCCVVLAMAVAMDPRYKLKLVEFSFAKVFGEEGEMWFRAVDDGLHELYFEYVAQTLPLPSIFVDQRYEGFIKAEAHQDEDSLPPPDGLSDFDVYISEISSNHQTKSELDQYLDEPLLPRGSQEVDVLEWWKLHRIKYPTLSKMAADILSIPFATISGDSVFDTLSKKLDSHRSSLKPVTLEALICANNWLQFGTQQSLSMLDLSTMCIKMETK